MAFLKKIIPFILVFSLSSIHAKVRDRTISQPITQQKPLPTQPIQRPIEIPQQPTIRPQSYAAALNIIRTQMPSSKVLVNNRFTQEFINFITSLNLSDVQTQALLEAGINLHAPLNDNDAMNQQLLSTLQNSIPRIIQSKSIQPTIPTTPIKPIKKIIPTAPIKPTKQPIPVAKTKPIKPIQPLQPIEQNVAIKKNDITHDAIIILDPRNSESESGGAMTQTAIAALYTKAAPIIMTSNILENIINAKRKIGSNDLQKLRNTKQEIAEQAKSILASRNVTVINSNELILMSHIDFDGKHFNYYFHKSAPLVLLIPKQYIDANFINATSLNNNQQARACGFNPAVVAAITNVADGSLIQQLQRQLSITIDEEQFTADLTSLFAPQKKESQLISLEEDTPWIMYLTGHGILAGTGESVANIRKQLQEDKNSLAFWQKILTQEKNDIQAKKWVPFFRSNVKENEKKLQGKSSWPDSHLIPASGRVAGLTIENFVQLMKFFNKNLNMAFLHYATCFAGGSNQSFVNKTLSSFDANFIVSSEGIDESTTKAKLLIDKENYPIRLESQLYGEFFRLLRMFITQPEKFVKIKGKSKDPIPMILRTIIPETIKENQPSVRFPSAGAFVALPLNKNTKVLTQTLVKSHEIEKKPIDLRNININMLIVNTPRINVPLNLGNDNDYKSIAIVFPSPKSNIPSYESMHVFKEINFNSPLQSFLYDCIYLNARMYTQTLVINKLTDIWYGASNLPRRDAIRNLIIQIKGVTGSNISATKEPIIQFTPLTPESIMADKIGVNVHIAFELNGAIYQSMFGIKNLENRYDLLMNIEKITFAPTPAQTTNMNALARNFLTPQEIAQVTKPITLKSIADFIDSKIDKQNQSMTIWSEADEDKLLKMVTEQAKKQKQK